MARIFDPALAPLGLHLVRAALESADGSRVDPHGSHLAIYVQPTGTYTATQYRQNFGPVAAVFLPRVFDRWPGVATFDVCQEPLASLDSRPEPPPVTQLLVSRHVAKQFNWKRMSIPKAKAAARRIGDKDFYVFINEGLLRQAAANGEGVTQTGPGGAGRSARRPRRALTMPRRRQ